jgi:hypothetical protein
VVVLPGRQVLGGKVPAQVAAEADPGEEKHKAGDQQG